MRARGLLTISVALFLGVGAAVSLAAPLAAPVDQYDCPALALSKYNYDAFSELCQKDPQTPFQNVCWVDYNYKPKDWLDIPSLLDSTVQMSFRRDLLQAGKNTPYCKALIDTQGPYERKLIACGKNGPCVVQVMRDRSWQLAGIEKRYTAPATTRETFEAFLGKEGSLRLDDEQTLEQRAIRGLSISPLPRAPLAEDLTISWGFEPHNAQLQSVLFSGAQGKVFALALVDSLYLDGEGKTTLPKDARIRLFVRDPGQLARILPGLQAWAAADALGMDVACNKPGVCEHWRQYPMPITAYRLPLPKINTPVPALGRFHQ